MELFDLILLLIIGTNLNMAIAPLVAAGLIGVGGSMLSAGAQAASSAGRTKRARRWQEGQYNKQRLHFLEDRDYNSPANQMQRYAEAGLNPHLIYGKGDSGNVSPQKASLPGTSQQPGQQFNIDPITELTKYATFRTAKATADKTENEADYLEQTLIDRVNEQYYKVSTLILQHEDLYKTLEAKKKAGAYKVLQSLKTEQLRLAEYLRSLREQGANERDPFYIRRAISQYSGNAKALNRVLNASAIATGITDTLPKNLLFGAGFLKSKKPTLKTNINATKGNRIIRY